MASLPSIFSLSLCPSFSHCFRLILCFLYCLFRMYLSSFTAIVMPMSSTLRNRRRYLGPSLVGLRTLEQQINFHTSNAVDTFDIVGSFQVTARQLSRTGEVIREQSCPILTRNSTTLVVGTPSVGWGNVEIILTMYNPFGEYSSYQYTATFPVARTVSEAPRPTGPLSIPPGCKFPLFLSCLDARIYLSSLSLILLRLIL